MNEKIPDFRLFLPLAAYCCCFLANWNGNTERVFIRLHKILMSSSSSSNEFNRLSQTLPAIKGIGILMVVIYHLWGFTRGYLPFMQIAVEALGSGMRGLMEGLLNTICLMGEQGVHFFLIASGFGLATSWWRQQNGVGRSDRPFTILLFWQRRVLRIFPLYWAAHGLALFLVLFVPAWVPFGQDIWQQGGISITFAWIASLTTLRNLSLPYYSFLNGAWWYVGLSVQLYLIFPWLVRIGKRWSWSVLLLGALLISLLYRSIIVGLPLNERAIDVLLRGALFPSRLFEFVLGMVLSIVLLEAQSSQLANAIKALLTKPGWLGLSLFLWSTGLACHWAASIETIAWRIPADALIGIGEFCFVFQMVQFIPYVKPALAHLGNYSYGIYLTHMNIFVGLWVIATGSVSSYWLRFALILCCTVALGILFELGYQQIEQRSRLKKKAI